MKHLIAGLALILTPGAASAQPAPAPGKCDLTVAFGSYAMGIDRPAFERIGRLLARDRRVTHTDEQRWGREGEVTICAKARRRADIAPLFYRIRAMLPRNPRGPVTVEAGARKFQAGKPPR